MPQKRKGGQAGKKIYSETRNFTQFYMENIFWKLQNLNPTFLKNRNEKICCSKLWVQIYKFILIIIVYFRIHASYKSLWETFHVKIM